MYAIFNPLIFQDTPGNTSPILEIDNGLDDSTIDSPATSRVINLVEVDPTIMDEPFDSGFPQSSAPIPIRYSRIFDCNKSFSLLDILLES